MPKIYALSDIHGYYEEMSIALKKIDLKKYDKLLFLGEYL